MTRRILSILLLITFLLAGCTAPAKNPVAPAAATAARSGGTQPGDTPWPTKDWQTSTPAEQGMDPARLEGMLAEIDKRRLDLDGVLVIRNGYIVSESYFGGTMEKSLHMQYSVTKSFISTLYGIALDQGKVQGVDQKVSEALPGRSYENPDPRKESMVVEDLLTMTSGLDWEEGDPAYRAMYRSPDWVKWVMDLPMAAEPGADFNYCSGCSHVIAAVVQQQVGDVEKFARENLFDPLGITELRWETDSKGMPIGGWGLNISARDMAKLGYLFLHKGLWDGKPVVSPDWVVAATTKHALGGGRLDYGYQWWIDSKNDAYAALGRGGQMIYVVPSLDLIVVFTAGEVSHDSELDLIDEFVLPAVR